VTRSGNKKTIDMGDAIRERPHPNGIKCQDVVAGAPPTGRPSVREFIRIGVDLAKNVFQLHGVEREDGSPFQRKLTRAKFRAFFAWLRPCRVGMEACGSAHYWARVLRVRFENRRGG
jgi:hypothetical protein